MSRLNAKALHLVGQFGDTASSKYYLIGSYDGVVHIKHGRMNVLGGKIIPVTEHKLLKEYDTEEIAREIVALTIEAKLKNGYVISPPSMRPDLNAFALKTKRIQSKKRVNLDKIQKQIRQVEEFNVEFGYFRDGIWRNSRDDRSGLPNYNSRYHRRLDGKRTIQDWKDLRISPHYPDDLDVRVFDARGKAVSPRTQLRSVRLTYEAD
jgi:hypothetical protein